MLIINKKSIKSGCTVCSFGNKYLFSIWYLILSTLSFSKTLTMGNVSGKKHKIQLTSQDIQFLIENTQYTQQEVEDWHSRFMVTKLFINFKNV